MSDGELLEYARRLDSEILKLDIKLYVESPEEFERQIWLSVCEGKDRFTPGINAVHQLYDSKSSVAPRLWNIYQFINRIVRDIVINRRRFCPGEDKWESIYSVDDYMTISLRDDAMQSASIHEILTHALLKPRLSNDLPFKNTSSAHQTHSTRSFTQPNIILS